MVKRLLPDDDLENLIQKLNATARVEAQSRNPHRDEDGEGDAAPPRPRDAARWRLPARTAEGAERLQDLLRRAREAHASDLLLVAGRPPTARVDGRLESLGSRDLDAAATGRLCAALLPDPRRPALEAEGAVDFGITRAGLGRLRCNVHRERDRWSAAVRLLPEEIGRLEDLGLPSVLSRFADLQHGLLLVTGPTGCGKSTTLAALVRQILTRRSVHLITIEDPVEFEHPHGSGVVEHIEIGRDASSFADALRSALRQDPDVLLIGEMRDPASMAIAVTAAETGHLVLSTLHTGDAPQTIHRILDATPPGQSDTLRVQLSISLAAVVSQQLLPRRDGAGRVPAVEVLAATQAVRNLIRQGKIAQLRSQLTLERQAGMLSLDASLAALVRDGRIDPAEARLRARSPEEFDTLLRRQG